MTTFIHTEQEKTTDVNLLQNRIEEEDHEEC
jgi:hypothetical protein